MVYECSGRRALTGAGFADSIQTLHGERSVGLNSSHRLISKLTEGALNFQIKVRHAVEFDHYAKAATRWIH